MADAPKSHDSYTPGQQRYTTIEHVNNPEALFGKIESGRYDWLGVQVRNGRATYWVGTPPAPILQGFAAGVASHHAADGTVPTGRHKVTVKTPRPVEMGPDEAWWVTAEEARADYDAKLVGLQTGPGSGLFRVTLFIDNSIVEQQLIVRVLDNRF